MVKPVRRRYLKQNGHDAHFQDRNGAGHHISSPLAHTRSPLYGHCLSDSFLFVLWLSSVTSDEQTLPVGVLIHSIRLLSSIPAQGAVLCPEGDFASLCAVQILKLSSQQTIPVPSSRVLGDASLQLPHTDNIKDTQHTGNQGVLLKQKRYAGNFKPEMWVGPQSTECQSPHGQISPLKSPIV